MDRFAPACKHFGLTINLKKMQKCRWWTNHFQSALLTMSWKQSRNLCTWVPQSLTSFPLRQNSTGTSERLPWHSPGWARKCGSVTKLTKRTEVLICKACMVTVSTLHYTEVDPGHCTPGKKDILTLFTCAVWVTSLDGSHAQQQCA